MKGEDSQKEPVAKARKKRTVFDTTVLFNPDKNSRDAQILLAVFNHRFLTSDQIRTLVEPGWHQRTSNARFARLVAGGYLTVPKIAEQGRRYKEGGGSFPKIFAVGRRGIDELHTIFGIPKSNLSHIKKNEDLKSADYMKHKLETSAFMVGVKESCDLHGYELVDEPDIIRYKSTDYHRQNQKRSREWYVPSCEKNIQSDRLFQILIPRLPEGRNCLNFVLEIDLSSETLEAVGDSEKGTIKSKCERYLGTLQEKLLPLHFTGMHHTFTALFVTNRKGRMNNMIKINQKIDGGSNRFWFSNLELIGDDIFTAPFYLGESGEETTILSMLETIK